MTRDFKRDVIKSRIAVLKAMDKAVRNMNDEDAFTPWLMGGVPDGADEDDYEFVAGNHEYYVETIKLFERIIESYAKEDF